MAVLVEAFSVVVKREAIERFFNGAWPAFVALVPNGTLCSDGQLASVAFLDPDEVDAFLESLQDSGLVFYHDGALIDMAVVHAFQGVAGNAPWLEFARISLRTPDQKVGACWLFEGPRTGAGLHLPAWDMEFAVPDGWVYEGSWSEYFPMNPHAPPNPDASA